MEKIFANHTSVSKLLYPKYHITIKKIETTNTRRPPVKICHYICACSILCDAVFDSFQYVAPLAMEPQYKIISKNNFKFSLKRFLLNAENLMNLRKNKLVIRSQTIIYVYKHIWFSNCTKCDGCNLKMVLLVHTRSRSSISLVR